jgi:SAM-dependent methyltransferase
MGVLVMGHWPLHARQWARVGPPLRPCPDDVAIAEAEAAAWARARGRAPRALVLGVTPELVQMAWPAGTSLLAVDREPAMIDALFAVAPGRRAAVGDWLALPARPGGLDLVVGDGSLSNLAFPDDYRRLAAELARVLAPGGRVVLRLFAAPEAAEPVAEAADALRAGAFGSFHALKWRVAMAIQPGHRNVRVDDIWRAFAELVPDRAALATRTGWPREVIDTIDAYRGSDVAYSFPTLAEVRAALAPALDEVTCHAPGYELGDRCPTLVAAAARAG